jgi:hypothetical protein
MSDIEFAKKNYCHVDFHCFCFGGDTGHCGEGNEKNSMKQYPNSMGLETQSIFHTPLTLLAIARLQIASSSIDEVI